MREIKFRAWHKPTQLMDDVVLIDFYNEKIGILYADPVMQCESIQKYNFNEVELMQYTCLKDKNGNEIYEGDILKIWIEGYEQASPYVVEDMRELYFELERDDSYYRIQETEVIGNIYENPNYRRKK